jgi:hypothetical protein
MTVDWQRGGDLLHGPLLDQAGRLPLTVTAVLCDLRPRFIAKGTAGRGYRAVARNGRVLLACDQSLAELVGRAARIRLQVWHRALLPGDRPEPYGLLVCIRMRDRAVSERLYQTRLAREGENAADLILDVGGGLGLEWYSSS